MYFDTLAHVQQGTQRVIAPIDRLRGRSERLSPAPPIRTYKAERSVFYSGFMIFPFGRGNVHLVVLIQAIWVAATFTAFLLARQTRPREAGLIALSILLFSPLCIISNVAIPDIFAGVICLSAGALLCYRSDLVRWQQAAWAANLAMAVSMHQAFGVVTVAVSCLALLLRRFLRIDAVGAALTLGAAAVGTFLLIAANTSLIGIQRGVNTTAPFLLGRLMGDGTAQRVLTEDCPRTHWLTCRYLPVSPLSENDFLWGGGVDVERPYLGYNQLPTNQQIQIKREAATIEERTLTRYWASQIPITLSNILHQFLDTDLNEFRQTNKLVTKYGTMPHGEWVYRTLIYRHPAILKAFSNCSMIAYWMSLLCAVWMMFNSCYYSDFVESDRAFLKVCMLFLIVNAAVCGALAGVFGRYQARFAWPFMLAVTALLVKGLRESNPKSISVSST
jgi:hypothetical protein